MNFLINYWWIILVIIAAIIVGSYCIYTFVNLPTDSQLTKVKEWLLYAVTEAEKKLGSGTGQIKLRYVYDMFITKFPYLTKAISFDTFSNLVDEVLEKFKALLTSNEELQKYVNETTEKEVTE